MVHRQQSDSQKWDKIDKHMKTLKKEDNNIKSDSVYSLEVMMDDMLNHNDTNASDNSHSLTSEWYAQTVEIPGEPVPPDPKPPPSQDHPNNSTTNELWIEQTTPNQTSHK